MFSYLSWSSTSLATVTPSLVIVGLPNFLSMTTLRPFGPSVAFTASAMMLTPLSRLARASSSNLSCFGMDRSPPWDRVESLLEDGEDVFLAQDQVVLAVDLHLVAGILPEQDPVTGLDVEGNALAAVVHLPRADGHDLGPLGLLLGGVGDDDAADLLLALFLALDEDAVVQRTDLLHRLPASLSCGGHRVATAPVARPALSVALGSISTHRKRVLVYPPAGADQAKNPGGFNVKKHIDFKCFTA